MTASGASSNPDTARSTIPPASPRQPQWSIATRPGAASATGRQAATSPSSATPRTPRTRPCPSSSPAPLPPRDRRRNRPLLLAPAHLAVELAPERLGERAAKGGRCGYTRFEQVVPGHLEAHAPQVGDVPQDRLGRGPERESQRQRLP